VRNGAGRRLHQVFELSVLLKGAHALIECASGLALALIPTTALIGLARVLTQHELSEDPKDWIAGRLLTAAETFSVSTQHFYVFYLLSHGIVKLLLVAALLRGKLWAYPASLVALGLFAVYQIYRFSFTHSAGLVMLTLFDAVVLVLIWHEYRVVRRHAPGG
jgi:uncharacterized membrane protein